MVNGIPTVSLRNYLTLLQAVSTGMLLCSCAQPDSVATVSCGAPPGIEISVRIGGAGGNDPAIALVNTHNLPPGAILQLDPPGDADEMGHASIAYVLNTVKSDFLTPRGEIWIASLASARLTIDLASASKSDVEHQLIKNTELLLLPKATRVTLRDPLSIINADSRAVDMLRRAMPRSRFVVVTGVTYGDNLELISLNYSASPDISINAVEHRHQYMHLRFSCSTLNSVTRDASRPDGEKSLLFFYAPIELDQAAKAVKPDGRALDLTNFSYPIK